MSTTLAVLALIAGLILLWKSGGWSVSNAIRFSIVFRIESFLIGFFIFAISTGLPEITSAVVSSLEKVPELSAGDLMGSTFVNLTLLLGISSIIARKLPVEKSLRLRLLGTIVTIVAIMGIVAFVPIPSLFLGIVLLLIYLLSFLGLRNGDRESFKEEVAMESSTESLWVSSPKVDILIKLAISLSLTVFSSWITVLAAVRIAKTFEIPIAVIGGTIIAIGTGLPELTLEIHAIRKKEYALALGDIFGSSLVNVSFVLGLLLMLNPAFDFTIAKTVLVFLIPAAVLIFYRLAAKTPFKIVDGVILILIFLLYFGKLSWSIA